MYSSFVAGLNITDRFLCKADFILSKKIPHDTSYTLYSRFVKPQDWFSERTFLRNFRVTYITPFQENNPCNRKGLRNGQMVKKKEFNSFVKYRKIPKSPGAYTFQGLFLWGLFLEGLSIFGGAYLRREICEIDWASCIVGSKLPFLLVLLCIWGQFSKHKPLGGRGGRGLHLEGWFDGSFFALPDWGANIWKGLYMEGLIFGILRYAWFARWHPIDRYT